MHELSIAQSLLEIVRQHVPPAEWGEVRVVRLKIGALAGVVPDSLEFSFTALTAGTPLSGARLDILHVPFVMRCRACSATSSEQLGIAVCPSCGSSDTETISGTELQLTEIELAQPAEAPS